MADNPKKPPLQEVATAEKDLDLFAGYMSRMENPDKVIRHESRGKGVVVYEELLREWQVASMLQIRSLALQGCEWQVDPASESPRHVQEAEFIQTVLKEANFDKLTNDSMQAVVTGYKPIEIMWEISEGQTWVGEFRGRRPSRFIFDMQCDLRLLTVQNSSEGEPVPPRKFMTWSFGGHDYNPYGTGLGYQLYWPCWFKKNDIKFWLMFCEKFGSPTPVGKYPPGADKNQQEKLLDACKAMQQESAIVIPDGMLIELLEAKRAGNVNSYKELCDYLDRSIAKVILGTPLYSEMGASGMGSEGMAQVLDQVRQDILKSDGDSMCETVNRTVVRWLVDYNFPSASRGMREYPKVWRRTEPEKDLNQQSATDKTLFDMGFEPSEAYINETYGGEWTKKQAPEPAPGQPAPGQSRKGGAPAQPENSQVPQFTECPHCHGQFAEGGADRDAVDAQVDVAGTAALPIMDDLIGPIRDLVARANSLEDIRDGLLDLYGQMDPADLGALMERAMTAAELLGISDVQDEVSDGA